MERLFIHHNYRRMISLPIFAATSNYSYKRDIAKIGKPVDRTEWQMTPPTINAYYEPTQNNINFPAGILAAAILFFQW